MQGPLYVFQAGKASHEIKPAKSFFLIVEIRPLIQKRNVSAEGFDFLVVHDSESEQCIVFDPKLVIKLPFDV